MNFLEAMELAKHIDAMAIALRDKLCNDIMNQPLEGEYIKTGKESGCVFAIIKYSTLQKHKIWAPDYYIPEAQAKAVSKYLKNKNCAVSICKAIKGLLQKKYIWTTDIYSDYNGSNRIILNENTVKAIRESELGQYVLQGKE